ncbi:MAG: hypothetical protein AAFR56_11820 [Chloroflexota bacterium]
MFYANHPIDRLSQRLSNLNLSIDRLTLFSFMWGFAALVHMEVFFDWLIGPNYAGYALFASIIVLLLRPTSITALMVMITLNILYSITRMPYKVNHILFEDMVNLTIIAAFIRTWYVARRRARAGKPIEDFRELFFSTFAPVVRVELVLLYGFATIAKLNADFFDLAISCAAIMTNDIIDTYSVLAPLNGLPGMGFMAVWGTLVIEGALAIGLFFRRTRMAAIVIGLPFHFMLGFHPIDGVYSFSTLIYALYALFVSREFVAELSTTLNRIIHAAWLQQNLKRLVLGAGIVIAVGVTAAVIGYVNMGMPAFYALDTIGFTIWSTTFTAMYLYVFWRVRQRTCMQPIFPKVGWVWALVGIVLLNGFSPYLGFKTQTSFTMFSNLRTEQHANHLFIPDVKLADFQLNLIQITESDHPTFDTYIEEDLLLTEFEFERLVNTTPDDFQITYTQSGETHTVQNLNGVTTLTPAVYSPLAGRLISFRPVYAGDTMFCRH